MSEQKYPIDFVVYWVDGSDPVWQAKKAKYSATKIQDATAKRYRDWDNLQYLFRGIEKFCPWVRYVYFVTDEQAPAWLNKEHPKLKLVNHKDYIPEAYLPTFKSRCIELNFHRIEGLSENFVAFNDDFFITKPMKPEDFFIDGKPVDIFVEYPVMCNGSSYTMPFELINIFNTLSKYLGPRKQYKKRLKKKILSPKYGSFFFYNLLMYIIPFPKFFGLLTPHFARPYLKSSFEELWEAEYENLDAACSVKFRCDRDYNIYTPRIWNLINGDFVPGDIFKMGKALHISEDDPEIYHLIEDQKYKLICINDELKDEQFDLVTGKVKESFQKILPEKSGFEL